MNIEKSEAAPKVLIVEDEAPVRAVERRVLEQQGYEVLEASDGLEGIAALDRTPHLDLLVADLNMPGLNGDEMVQRIRIARPDIRVLYVTGCIDQLMDSRPLLEGEAFLEKPFTPGGLQEAVSLLIFGTISRKR